MSLVADGGGGGGARRLGLAAGGAAARDTNVSINKSLFITIRNVVYCNIELSSSDVR